MYNRPILDDIKMTSNIGCFKNHSILDDSYLQYVDDCDVESFNP